jgi:hypothetical protein
MYAQTETADRERNEHIYSKLSHFLTLFQNMTLRYLREVLSQNRERGSGRNLYILCGDKRKWGEIDTVLHKCIMFM